MSSRPNNGGLITDFHSQQYFLGLLLKYPHHLLNSLLYGVSVSANYYSLAVFPLHGTVNEWTILDTENDMHYKHMRPLATTYTNHLTRKTGIEF